jgi:MFS family permease
MSPDADNGGAGTGGILVVVCMLTFLHYVGAQMRGPVLPLYAAAHGATATGVGLIIGAHTMVAAGGSIVLGRASDVWGRRPLLLGGMTVSAVTSLLLPFVEGELGLTAIYGLAGLGVAAFTPSALSLVGDTAAPGRAGHAYAWYSTAHYGAIAIGPFLGGLAAEWWGYRAAFVASAAGIAVALAVGLVISVPRIAHASARSGATFADIRGNASVWAGWIVSVSGLFIQGVIFAFFPLFAHDRAITPAAIGLVFLVLGLANTLARFPAGWLVDRTKRCPPYAIGGILVGSVTTALLPHVSGELSLLVLVAVFGAVSGIAFVAVSVALAASTTPSTRGLVMGGYSTSLYLGLALGSFALGPVITRHGYVVGFAAGGAAGVIGTLVAAMLWARSGATPPRSRAEPNHLLQPNPPPRHTHQAPAVRDEPRDLALPPIFIREGRRARNPRRRYSPSLSRGRMTVSAPGPPRPGSRRPGSRGR